MKSSIVIAIVTSMTLTAVACIPQKKSHPPASNPAPTVDAPSAPPVVAPIATPIVTESEALVIDTEEEAAVRSLLAKYPAVSAVSAPLAALISGQPNAVLTAISKAILSVRALPAADLQTFMDGLTGAITSDSAANKLQAISALRPFISTWDTTKYPNSNQTVTLGLVSSGTYDFSVDWGDSSSDHITSWSDPKKAHVYTEPGVRTIKITGVITGWLVSNPYNGPFTFSSGPGENLIGISNWGQFKFGSGSQNFQNAKNLKITAQDIPDLGGTTQLFNTFAFCATLDTVPNMEKWDTSGVTAMPQTFLAATAFDQPIGDWDTSKVTNMASMFFGATAFNQPIGNWDTSAVTGGGSMFSGMTGMFSGATTFNQDLSGWDTSHVLYMASMFKGATAFNNDGQPLTWNTAAVTIMNQMFRNATAFNQDIHTWNTGAVIDSLLMFDGAAAMTESFKPNFLP